MTRDDDRSRLHPGSRTRSADRPSGTEGAHYSATELQEAMFARTRIYGEIQGWFQHYDMIATPTLARTALVIDHDFFAPIEIDGEPTDTVRKAWYPYTHSFNLSGNPAVTLPCGRDDGGLPVGLQLVGLCLSEAALFEVSVPWVDRTPPLSG
jgi:aspartyl-tRNA(Asn)/glutamyl-tRNA(Gln) amidotransferase subunit A